MDARGDDLGGAEAELYSGLLQVLQLQHKDAESAAKGDLARSEHRSNGRHGFHGTQHVSAVPHVHLRRWWVS